MFKLDTKKFKKISSDKDKTVMQHEDGHQLHIDHKKIHPKLKAQLIALKPEKKYADGGEINSYEDQDKKAVKNEKEDTKESAADLFVKGFKKALGDKDEKETKKYAQGGKVEAEKIESDLEIEPIKPKHPLDFEAIEDPRPLKVEKINDKQVQRKADGGEIETQPKRVDDFDAMVNSFSKASPDRYAADQASLPQAQEEPQSIVGREPTSVQPEAPPQEQTNSLTPSIAPQQPQSPPVSEYERNVQGAYDTGMQGIEKQQAADQQIGAERTKALADNTIKVEGALADFDTHSKEIGSELEHFTNDIKAGHINPDKYWDDHSKVAASIGLILAGFNPTNKPNAVGEYLDKQIDRSIQSQIADMDRKKTIIGALQQQFGNVKDAANMTKLYLAADLTNKLDMAAARATDPQAQARALQAKSQLMQQYAPLYRQMSVVKSLQSGDQSPDAIGSKIAAMKMVPEMKDLAKHYEDRYVPGVGLAQTPISEPIKERLIKQATLINATKNLRDWVGKHGASVDPRVRSEGEALASELQQMYRQGVGASTSKEEQGIIEDNIISNSPAQLIKRWNVDPKLKALQDSMISSNNVTRKMSGLPLTEQESDMPQKGPDGRMYARQVINGKAYMVPVKKGK